MSIFCGVDPGKTGALCVLNIKTDEVEFFDWPKDNNYVLYFNKLSNYFKKYRPNIIVLERVNAMPNQGVTSMFNFGLNYGLWQGFLAILGIPFVLISPKEWQKGYTSKQDGRDTKTQIYNVATKLFPKAPLTGLKGGIITGRCDSLLMAYYASR
jgi:crossover junction endodeoxyribonuclease RuvC